MAKRFGYSILASILLFFVSLDISHAACTKSLLAGVWKAKSYTRFSPKRIEIIHNCNASGKSSEWVLRVFNHCRPRDCIWGRVNASSGLSGVLEANFSTFSARRNVKVRPMGYKLEIEYFIDYRSEGRKDLKGRVYLVR